MLASVSSALTGLVESYGILAVLMLMALESCGVPIPSEIIMPFAGAFAAQGHLSLAGAIAAGAVGNLVGSLVAYLLARRYGAGLLLGPGRRIGLSGSHLELAERWFSRYGLVTVFFGRMLPVIRTYVSFPAGLARVELVRFSVLTLLGAIPWCIALAWAGYAVGANYDRISAPIQLAAVVLAVIVVGLVVAWFVRGRRLGARPAA